MQFLRNTLGNELRQVSMIVAACSALAVMASSSSCFTHSNGATCETYFASAPSQGIPSSPCQDGYECTANAWETLNTSRPLVGVGSSGTTSQLATKCRHIFLCEKPGFETKTCYSVGSDLSIGQPTKYRSLSSCTGSTSPE